MRRRTFIRLAGLGAAVLAGSPVTAGCAAGDEPGQGSPGRGGATFYVAAAGDDRDSGRELDRPWKTIRQVNAQLDAGTVRPGDSVLFERGHTFYGKIRPVAGSGSYLTLGAYSPPGRPDPCARPVISSYKLLNNTAGWVQLGQRTWQIDLAPAAVGETHTGYDGSAGGYDNIGFLNVDGVIHGHRVWAESQLAQQWDFYCAPPHLVVYSDGNPAQVARDLRAACDTPGIELTDYLQISGLKIEGSGGHGVRGTASHVRIQDNEFAEIGGAALAAEQRYGNGVEVWIGSSDVIVENNVVHDVYDAALTMQGDAGSPSDGWRDVAFRNNLVFRCNQSIEFWSEYGGKPAPGFVGCVAERNLCLFAGRGWSADVRPDLDTRVHLLTYSWELPADLKVQRNVFYDAPSGYRYSATDPVGMVRADNVILQRTGLPLESGGEFTVEDSQKWLSGQHGNESGSIFRVLPANVPFDVGSAVDDLRAWFPDYVTAPTSATVDCSG